MTQNENEKAKNSPKLFKRLNKTLRNDLCKRGTERHRMTQNSTEWHRIAQHVKNV